MNLIEKLKDKTYVRAFGLMSPEEQECFEKVGKENCLGFSEAISPWKDIGVGTFLKSMTYAIKPDYQPEPEFENIEVKRADCDGYDWLGIHDGGCSFSLPYAFTHLHCLPSLPNFECFYRKDTCANVFADRVSRCISKGQTVYARFRK